jgi:hypothetical protein
MGLENKVFDQRLEDARLTFKFNLGYASHPQLLTAGMPDAPVSLACTRAALPLYLV